MGAALNIGEKPLAACPLTFAFDFRYLPVISTMYLGRPFLGNETIRSIFWLKEIPNMLG